jgi:hypothetical protein
LGHSQVLWFISRDGSTALDTGEVVTVFVITTLLIILADNGSENLHLATENHGKAFTTDRFVNARETGTVAPLIKFTTECVGLKFEEPKLSGGQ